MKKIILILVFLPVFAAAQTPAYDSNKLRQPVNIYGNDFKGNYRFGTTLVIPKDTVRMSVGDSGAVAFKGGYQWFWNGYTWVKNSTGSGATNFWKDTGNAGTTPGTNFIGTTDNVDFVMKRNGIDGAWLDYNPTISATELNATSLSSIYAYHQALTITSGISPSTRYTTFDPLSLTTARSLRIPDSSGTIALLQNIPGTSDLQQVTDIGHETTNDLTLTSPYPSRNSITWTSDAGTNYGQLTYAGNTGNNLWTLPNASGVVPISVNGNTANAAGAISITSGAGSGTVTGSGTLNYVPKWSSSTALGNSSIIDDGSLVTVTNPVTTTDTITTKNIKLSTIAPYSLLRNIQNSFGGTDSVVIAAGVIRGDASGGAGSRITWRFISDYTPDHGKLYFDSVASVATGAIRVYFPNTVKVVSFLAGPDESLSNDGMVMGASVETSYADIFCWLPAINGGKLTGNGGASWTASSTLSAWTISYNSGTGTTYFNAGGNTPNLNYDNVSVMYQGSNPYLVKRSYSGLGAYNAAFQLTDILGNPITGNTDSNDKVTLTFGATTNQANAYQVDGSGIAPLIWGATANIWVIAVFKK